MAITISVSLLGVWSNKFLRKVQAEHAVNIDSFHASHTINFFSECHIV